VPQAALQILVSCSSGLYFLQQSVDDRTMWKTCGLLLSSGHVQNRTQPFQSVNKLAVMCHLPVKTTVKDFCT